MKRTKQSSVSKTTDKYSMINILKTKTKNDLLNSFLDKTNQKLTDPEINDLLTSNLDEYFNYGIKSYKELLKHLLENKRITEKQYNSYLEEEKRLVKKFRDSEKNLGHLSIAKLENVQKAKPKQKSGTPAANKAPIQKELHETQNTYSMINILKTRTKNHMLNNYLDKSNQKLSDQEVNDLLTANLDEYFDYGLKSYQELLTYLLEHNRITEKQYNNFLEEEKRLIKIISESEKKLGHLNTAQLKEVQEAAPKTKPPKPIEHKTIITKGMNDTEKKKIFNEIDDIRAELYQLRKAFSYFPKAITIYDEKIINLLQQIEERQTSRTEFNREIGTERRLLEELKLELSQLRGVYRSIPKEVPQETPQKTAQEAPQEVTQVVPQAQPSSENKNSYQHYKTNKRMLSDEEIIRSFIQSEDMPVWDAIGSHKQGLYYMLKKGIITNEQFSKFSKELENIESVRETKKDLRFSPYFQPFKYLFKRRV